jgi:hypothetical protein
MSFSKTSKKIVLNGSVLTARCQRRNRTWSETSLNLNSNIRNNNGWFHIRSAGFSRSAQEITVSYSPAVLRAKLHGPRCWIEDSVNLDRFITNNDGKLQFLDW